MVIYITLSGLKIRIVNYSYVRLLIRLPFGLTDSAAAPPSAKSCPYMLLPLLFLLNVWLGLSSTDANVSSNSNNIEGQLSFKCTKASDCITAAQGIIIHHRVFKSWNFNGSPKGTNSKGINSWWVCSEQNLNDKSQNLKNNKHLNHEKTFIPRRNPRTSRKWHIVDNLVSSVSRRKRMEETSNYPHLRIISSTGKPILSSKQFSKSTSFVNKIDISRIRI